VKALLSIVFLVGNFFGALLLGLHPTLGVIFYWPLALVYWLFGECGTSGWVALLFLYVGWSAPGFLIGAWIDARAKRRELEKKYLKD
jgi:hypothetical protein